MKIEDIGKVLKDCKIYGNHEVEFLSLQHDSRKIRKGDLFVAISGQNNDGHNFIEDAIKNGAVGAIIEKETTKTFAIPLIKVDDSKVAYAILSAHMFNNPSSQLKIVGITGTMGKTTIAYILYRLFNYASIPSSFIGTIGIGIKDDFELKDLEPPTTPFPFELNKYLSLMKDNNVKYVFMEVTSHAIKDKRVFGIDFYKKILSTMGVDHLDFHKTLEDYLDTKVSFFVDAFSPILNGESLYIERFLEVSKDPLLYGENPSFDFSYEFINSQDILLLFNVFKKGSLVGEVKIPLVSKFNIVNFLAATSFAMVEGIPFSVIREFGKTVSIPGRMEIRKVSDRVIVVDYAHNPSEIRSVLENLSLNKKGRLIVVFGAVGTSNTEKRIEMGRVVSNFADFCYVTSDDSRGFDEKKIIDDILKGVSIDHKVLEDRRLAIKEAVLKSKPNDTIAILGRGVESKMHLKGGRIVNFRDLDVVEETVYEL